MNTCSCWTPGWHAHTNPSNIKLPNRLLPFCNTSNVLMDLYHPRFLTSAREMDLNATAELQPVRLFCGVVSIVVDHVQCYDAINGQFTHCSIVIAREYLPLPDFCGMIFTTPGLHTSCVLFLLTSFSLIILLGLLIPMASMHAEWSSLLRSSCRDKTNC